MAPKKRIQKLRFLGIILLLTLVGSSGCYVRTKRVLQAHLRSYPEIDPAAMLEMGPFLGQTDKTYFTLTCKTEDDTNLVLETDNRTLVSSDHEYHHFLVQDLQPATTYEIRLRQIDTEGKEEKAAGPFLVTTFPDTSEFTFAILGDSRCETDAWSRVATAIYKKSPLFMVHLGDYTKNGMDAGEWRRDFWNPAKKLLASVPTFAIRGNHEDRSEIYPKVFYIPDDEPNWIREIGPMLLIGIDGDLDWTRKSDNIEWLEEVLATTRAKFIFFCTHYPAWSSHKHGDTQFGYPADREVKEAQQVIAPLLQKYRVTAMFNGHCHLYERSEMPGGLTLITTGGAGSPLGEIDNDAEEQNPYSVKIVREHHYLLITVTGNECRMQALTPEGKLLDTKTWRARNL
ncbi:MAG: metallophosphoesterase [Planctomycetes bacterium]|nr:metallophosphoesterase [Planctomycetota bacterium]